MPRVDGTGQVWISTDELQGSWFGGEVPESEQFRRYFGRNVTAPVIEQCIYLAMNGYLRDLTDLSYETMLIDPHLGSTWGKRARALASVEPQVVAATGDGIDPTKAAFYADVVRQQLEWIPNLRQHIVRMTWGHYHARALLEKVWRENPPGSRVRWRIDYLTWIHPRRIAFGPERELRIRDDVWQGGNFEARGFDIRQVPQKFIPFTPQLFDDYPEREGLALRALYFSYFKRFGWRERLILMEIFGQPWRWIEVMPDAAAVPPEVLDRGKDTAEKMGAHTAGQMPKGLKLNVAQPAEGAGQVHKDVVQECDDQISKLILGNTRTTDAKADGLGGQQALVHQDEQGLVIAADGWNVGDVLTERFAGDIIRLNFGEDELSHCPRVKIAYEPPPDRSKEIERTSKAIAIGVPLKLDEVYERIGFSKPEPGDAIIQQSSGGGGGLFGPAGPTTRIVDPNAPDDGTGGAAPTGAADAPELAAPAAPDLAGGELAIAAAVRREAELLHATLGARTRLGDHVCCARQPETVNGSPEVLIESGVRESARITKAWGDALVEAVAGLETAGEIFEALTRTANGLELGKFARAAERRILHGVMLGAMDSNWERENEALVSLEHFSAPRVLAKEPGLPSFVGKPFAEAIRLFKERQVLERDKFEQLTAAAKRRAFTVARLARQELLVAAHAELSRQIESSPATGPKLGDFKKFVAERLETAGWTPANPSHVETIYRTNVVGAYSAGRHAEMTQPEVLQARPYWQWFSVRDDRARATHRAAHGTLLPADHDFWQRAFPPAGYNCRCRVVSRSQRWFEANGGASSAVPDGLPDDGFTGGAGALLSADL